MNVTGYGLSKKVNSNFAKAEARIRETLMEQGFGILTEIDVKATMKSKLNLDMKNYKILGACNPGYASRALSAEKEIGLLLPCNVIVYDDDNGETHVSAVDPISAMGVVGNNALSEMAAEVREKLATAIKAI